MTGEVGRGVRNLWSEGLEMTYKQQGVDMWQEVRGRLERGIRRCFQTKLSSCQKKILSIYKKMSSNILLLVYLCRWIVSYSVAGGGPVFGIFAPSGGLIFERGRIFEFFWIFYFSSGYITLRWIFIAFALHCSTLHHIALQCFARSAERRLLYMLLV